MRIIDCQQGGPEWVAARLGVVTGSRFNEILTPKKLEPAKGDAYLRQLVAEWFFETSMDDGSSGATERGQDMEPEARAWYAMHVGCDVEQVGFILSDDERIGCSPDGLVGDDGILELKVPLATTHVGYFLDPSSLVMEYRGQIQAAMLVTGRKWVDIVSYNPSLPPVVRRVKPDAVYLEALAPALAAFLARLDDAKSRLADAKREREESMRPAPVDARRSREIDEILSRPEPAPVAPMTDAEIAAFDDALPF